MPNNSVETLDIRLEKAAETVRQGKKAADIGCDHAYLSVYLIKNGISPHVIACDLRPGPLEAARRNIERVGYSEYIETRLADGLNAVLPGEAEDIVICGMGGILISDIISRAVWLKDEKIHLVLQPMTHAHVLRKFLYENGFYIDSEQAVISAGHVYSVMSVFYSGNITPPDDVFLLTGMVVKEKSDASHAYIEREIIKLEKQNNGLMRSVSPDLQLIEHNKRCINALTRLLEEN